MNLAEISKIQDQVKKSDLDAIVLLNDSEHHLKDPFFQRIVCSKDVTAAIIITKDMVSFIVHEIEADNVVEIQDTILELSWKNIVSWKSWWAWHTQALMQELNNIGVKKVWFNYSEGFSRLDHLSAWTIERLRKAWVKYHPQLDIVSWEDIIFNISSIRTPREIEALESAQNIAHQIILKTFQQIKAWMTELEAQSLLQSLYKKRISELEESWEIVKWELSWEEELCPIVITWRNWEKWGHAEPWNEKIIRGNTLYFDFWVKLTFSDGITMSSDIQRTAYLLKEWETNAPKEVQDLFNTIHDSIHSSLWEIYAWMTWIEADRIVRNKIINFWKKMYRSSWNEALREVSEIWYNHGTWHAIWEHAHDIWTSLSSSEWNLKARKKLEEWMTITIEPRIAIENGISIEEMVVVWETWCQIIWESQDELILI